MAQTRNPTPPPSRLERAIAAGGFVIVAAAFAILIGHALFNRGGPADLDVRSIGIADTGDGWRMDIEVRNTGGRTAAEVHVHGDNRGEVSTSVLDYVPGNGRRTSALVFSERPDEVELRISGWSDP